MSSPEIKQQLVASTAQAVNRGAFGVPMMFITVTPGSDVPVESAGEMVFGSDQFVATSLKLSSSEG